MSNRKLNTLYIFPKKIILFFCNSRCGPMHDRSQAVQEHEKRSHDWYSLRLLFHRIPVFCPKCWRICFHDFWRLFWQHSLVIDCSIWGHWCCLLLWVENVSFNIQSGPPKLSYWSLFQPVYFGQNLMPFNKGKSK